MPKQRKVIVTKRRSVHAYAELWHASNCVLTAGIENHQGSAWQFLSSLVLTAFAFEAYLNHVGAATFDCWKQLDRLPPASKLDLLCEELGVSFTEGHGARPLQTINELLRFRNTVAHGRSAELEPKPLIRTAENYQTALDDRVLTDWEQLVQSETFAKCAREDVKAVCEKIHAARRDKKEHLFAFGLGSHAATFVDEP
jgi:hypothetical protein